jgi:hypothetical protein
MFTRCNARNLRRNAAVAVLGLLLVPPVMMPAPAFAHRDRAAAKPFREPPAMQSYRRCEWRPKQEYCSWVKPDSGPDNRRVRNEIKA